MRIQIKTHSFHSYLFTLTLLTLIVSQASSSDPDRVCNEISISSNATRFHDDMAVNGVVHPKWSKDSSTPVIITDSKEIDWIYFFVKHKGEILKDENFKLTFDDHFYSEANLKLDPSQKEEEVLYTAQIDYKCKSYGGALITFSLTIDIPHCGSATVYWKKLCGNPLVPRDGLSINLEMYDKNSTIVENGLIVNASAWDRDIDNYVFNVPENINETKFYIFMVKQSNTTINETSADPAMEAIRSVLRMVPTTKFSKPKVDADVSILSPVLSGSAAEGGVIDFEPKSLVLTYKCAGRKKQAQIELNIMLDFFRDITLVFVKSCDGIVDHFQEERSTLSVLLIWFVIIMFISCCIGTIVNYVHYKKQGLDMIPGLEKALNFAINLKLVKNSNIGSKLENFNKKHFHSISQSELDESEFKIENINELSKKEATPSKYGAI